MGLMTLSNYLRDFLKNNLPNISIETFLLPTENVEIKFNFEEFCMDPSIVTIGHWQRLYDNINKIKGIRKKFLKWNKLVDVNWIYKKHGFEKPKDIEVVNTLNNQEYDNFLSKNVVFLELFDAAANNIVVECIVRNNPVIINRLPSLYEYLGEDYPLYYENFDDAQNLVLNIDKIREGHIYLQKKDKSIFDPNYFMNCFKQSSIYQSLPLLKFL